MVFRKDSSQRIEVPNWELVLFPGLRYRDSTKMGVKASGFKDCPELSETVSCAPSMG